MAAVTVAELKTRVRTEADIETADEANSVVTDAELESFLTQGLRSLVDIILRTKGRERLYVSVSLGPSSWVLPEDFYRAVAVDFADGSSAEKFAFRNRSLGDLIATPRWRVLEGELAWRGTPPTAAVTLWYVPVPEALAEDGSFDGFSGWDEYVVQYAVRKCRVKQEESTAEATSAMMAEEARIRTAASGLGQEPETIVDLTSQPDARWYNS
jgi:hypothetical protein